MNGIVVAVELRVAGSVACVMRAYVPHDSYVTSAPEAVDAGQGWQNATESRLPINEASKKRWRLAFDSKQ